MPGGAVNNLGAIGRGPPPDLKIGIRYEVGAWPQEILAALRHYLALMRYRYMATLGRTEKACPPPVLAAYSSPPVEFVAVM